MTRFGDWFSVLSGVLGPLFSLRTLALWASTPLHLWGCPDSKCGVKHVPYSHVAMVRGGFLLSERAYEVLCRVRESEEPSEAALNVINILCAVRDKAKLRDRTGLQ